jgi:hypothetical protein
VAPLVVRGWRKPGVLVAMLVGMAAGTLEWVAEASMWFGGLSNRILLAGQEPPKLSLNFSIIMQARVLSGPWYCPSNGACPDWPFPFLILWWMALVGLVALGLYAAWRSPAKASTVLAVVTGAWCAALYILFVPFGAPRYLLPTWALFAIVAADGIVWMATVPDWKKAGAAVACVFLLTGVVTQHLVLVRETANEAAVRPFIGKADTLLKLGIKPPCMIFSPSVAYYVGCTAPWSVDPADTASTMKWIRAHTAGGHGWHEIHVPGPVPNVWVKR